MLVTCTLELLVAKCDEHGFEIENENLFIEEGTIWKVENKENVMTLNNLKEQFNWIEIPKDTFDLCFKPITCAYCLKEITNEDDINELQIDKKLYHFHKDCDYIPAEHLIGAVGNTKN